MVSGGMSDLRRCERWRALVTVQEHAEAETKVGNAHGCKLVRAVGGHDTLTSYHTAHDRPHLSTNDFNQVWVAPLHEIERFLFPKGVALRGLVGLPRLQQSSAVWRVAQEENCGIDHAREWRCWTFVLQTDSAAPAW